MNDQIRFIVMEWKKVVEESDRLNDEGTDLCEEGNKYKIGQNRTARGHQLWGRGSMLREYSCAMISEAEALVADTVIEILDENVIIKFDYGSRCCIINGEKYE